MSRSRTRIPEFVVVYGKEVPIVFKDKMFDEKGNELHGDTDGSTIWISSASPTSTHLTTLLHEMWHCITRRMGTVYRNDHDENLEEQHAEYFQTIISENWILRSKHV